MRYTIQKGSFDTWIIYDNLAGRGIVFGIRSYERAQQRVDELEMEDGE